MAGSGDSILLESWLSALPATRSFLPARRRPSTSRPSYRPVSIYNLSDVSLYAPPPPLFALLSSPTHDAMNDVSCLLHNLPSHRHRGPPLPPMAFPSYHQRPAYHPQDWRPQAQPQTLFAGALAPSAWTNAGPSHSQASSLWPSGPPDFLLPFHHYPPKEYGASACESCMHYVIR